MSTGTLFINKDAIYYILLLIWVNIFLFSARDKPITTMYYHYRAPNAQIVQRTGAISVCSVVLVLHFF